MAGLVFSRHRIPASSAERIPFAPLQAGGLREDLIPPVLDEVRAPLSVAAYHASHDTGRRRSRLVEHLAHGLARGVSRLEPRHALRFGEVTVSELAVVRSMRRRVYQDSLPALLGELDAHDQDRYDAHSFLFAAWLDDKPIATVRCTTYPYETLRYVAAADLARQLGPAWQRDYIEVGRMAAERAYRDFRLMPALITYAGLRLLAETPYHKYLGYARSRVRDRLRGFSFEDGFTFRIPERGDHEYALLHGDAWRDLVLALPRFVANSLTAAASRARPSAGAGA